jgi:predicted Zn-dependent peptidase
MNSIKSLSVFAALWLLLASACSTGSKTEGDVTEAKVGGMTIIVKHVPTAELATARLFIRGGSRNWTKADAGIELLAVNVAATGGTESLDKVAFGRRLASLGGMISASAGEDWSVLQAKGPVRAYDELFGLLADVFLRPALPASEIEVAREQQIAQIRHSDEDPDGRLALLVNQQLWKGHPYENLAQGTLEVVQKLTRDQIAAHLARLRETSRLVLVVVGNVDPAEAIETAKTALAKVPEGNYVHKPLPKPDFGTATFFSEERKLPTNYIQGGFVGAPVGTEEYAASLVLTTMLSERLFEEVRTKRNLSYAPGTGCDVSETATTCGIYVTAVDPNKTLPVMIDELKRAQSTPLSDDDLEAAKAQTRTGMLMGTETTDGLATALGRAFLLTGDWRYRNKLLDQIANVTAADLQAYAKQRFGKLQVVLLGNPKSLDEKVATSF